MSESWPNSPEWSALRERELEVGGKPVRTHLVSAGELFLPTGDLVVCDPFVALAKEGMVSIKTPAGRHPVTVTLADVSGALDGSHLRNAYLSIAFSEEAEVKREALMLVEPGNEPPELKPGEFLGFGVDTATACFADAEAIRRCMPEEATWLEEVFDTEEPDGWFNRLGDSGHLPSGIANVELPLATQGENIILAMTGWGDGSYPVVAGHDEAGQLVAIHVDFFVIDTDP